MEYLVEKWPLNKTRATSDRLTELAKEGWEVDQAVPNGHDLVVILKRWPQSLSLSPVGVEVPEGPVPKSPKRGPGRPKGSRNKSKS